MSPRLQAVLDAIDEANAKDPRQEIAGGASVPKELLYAQRMSEYLLQLYPDASEGLRIAARGQHVCRWQIPRSSYPLGREGYNAWRAACRELHAKIVSDIMEQNGYPEAARIHVADIIKKRRLKSDPESQALENVVAAVFVRYYLEEFVQQHADYDTDKLLDILRKTFRKVDAAGIAAVRGLGLPAHLEAAVAAALGQ